MTTDKLFPIQSAEDCLKGMALSFEVQILIRRHKKVTQEDRLSRKSEMIPN
jgi:hypothetical protein